MVAIATKERKMKKPILLLTLLFSFAYSSYSVGQTVSISDQNITQETCYSGNGYNNGDDWKLLDWNGAENGGQYNVMFIAMHASW